MLLDFSCVPVYVFFQSATVENGWTLSRFMSTIDAMTQEQIERLRKLVDESGVDIWYRETGAAGIICEEAAGYYQGNKSLEQVIEVIEGRLRMYREN